MISFVGMIALKTLFARKMLHQSVWTT